MTADYYDQARSARIESANMTAQLASCLNGTWRGRTADGDTVGCYRAETLDAKERSKK